MRTRNGSRESTGSFSAASDPPTPSCKWCALSTRIGWSRSRRTLSWRDRNRSHHRPRDPARSPVGSVHRHSAPHWRPCRAGYLGTRATRPVCWSRTPESCRASRKRLAPPSKRRRGRRISIAILPHPGSQTHGFEGGSGCDRCHRELRKNTKDAVRVVVHRPSVQTSRRPVFGGQAIE